MIKRPNTNAQRQKRHTRVRGKVSGTSERPRLNVFRSGTNIYAQIIDDSKGVTLVAASSLEKGFEGRGNNVEAAEKVGEAIGQRAKDKGIDCVVFDRGWPRAPARPAWNFKGGGNEICLDLKENPASMWKKSFP